MRSNPHTLGTVVNLVSTSSLLVNKETSKGTASQLVSSHRQSDSNHLASALRVNHTCLCTPGMSEQEASKGTLPVHWAEQGLHATWGTQTDTARRTISIQRHFDSIILSADAVLVQEASDTREQLGTAFSARYHMSTHGMIDIVLCRICV